jgi:hypothetical protein
VLEDKYANAITELAQIRNVFVHKAGIVDGKLLEACGWLKPFYKIGDKIKLSYHDIDRYFVACSHMVQQILDNLHKRLIYLGETSESFRSRYQELFIVK